MNERARTSGGWRTRRDEERETFVCLHRSWLSSSKRLSSKTPLARAPTPTFLFLPPFSLPTLIYSSLAQSCAQLSHSLCVSSFSIWIVFTRPANNSAKQATTHKHTNDVQTEQAHEGNRERELKLWVHVMYEKGRHFLYGEVGCIYYTHTQIHV